jgi:hypothetical protein
MKRMKLQALLCVRCLLAVEKMGRIWVAFRAEVKETKEKEGARQLPKVIGGFGDENMGNGSTVLARE